MVKGSFFYILLDKEGNLSFSHLTRGLYFLEKRLELRGGVAENNFFAGVGWTHNAAWVAPWMFTCRRTCWRWRWDKCLTFFRVDWQKCDKYFLCEFFVMFLCVCFLKPIPVVENIQTCHFVRSLFSEVSEVPVSEQECSVVIALDKNVKPCDWC